MSILNYAKMRLTWYLRQLLPLTYRTHYTDTAGQRHFCVWQMWFGRCFNVESYAVVSQD